MEYWGKGSHTARSARRSSEEVTVHALRALDSYARCVCEVAACLAAMCRCDLVTLGKLPRVYARGCGRAFAMHEIRDDESTTGVVVRHLYHPHYVVAYAQQAPPGMARDKLVLWVAVAARIRALVHGGKKTDCDAERRLDYIIKRIPTDEWLDPKPKVLNRLVIAATRLLQDAPTTTTKKLKHVDEDEPAGCHDSELLSGAVSLRGGGGGSHRKPGGSSYRYFSILERDPSYWRSSSHASWVRPALVSLFAISALAITLTLLSALCTRGNAKPRARRNLIDAHDAVFRFNGAVTEKFKPYVGQKTTFRLVNEEYLDFREKGDEVVLHAPRTSETLTAFTKRASYQKNKERPVYLFTPEFMHLVEKSVMEFEPTIGWTGMLLAMQICRRVDLFGFFQWEQHGMAYHYFDTCGHKRNPAQQERKDDMEWVLVRSLTQMQMLHFMEACVVECHLAASLCEACRARDPSFRDKVAFDSAEHRKSAGRNGANCPKSVVNPQA
ncbi:ST6 beta-galactosamide alpha-2,6-sialyltransferase 1 [Pycnococcus provasolii]|uniref:beta-galactoside alpha-(2,6)-sialyltransferase n=1 Tax=Pycnococcus provasolii TaxID=41880 RepID=A0A830HN12_9CHLO|nr:ST6 beta-galactosamide alpha-2,6-sialyltransferase 1 [Pycnococcus provasolii]